MASTPSSRFPRHDNFERRHLGPSRQELKDILQTLGCETLDELTDKAVPDEIRSAGDLRLPPARSETEALAELHQLAAQNEVFRSYLGMGYHGTITPTVIQRNILENPGWYT